MNTKIHFVFVCLAFVVCLTHGKGGRMPRIYNIVVLGNTGVGKSSLMNMLAQDENLFTVGHSAASETQLATVKQVRFLGKKKNFIMRLVVQFDFGELHKRVEETR